jgi:hypothetical protein
MATADINNRELEVVEEKGIQLRTWCATVVQELELAKKTTV